MSISENNFLQYETNSDIQNILSNAVDWQDALGALMDSNLNISEKKVTDIVEKHFFKRSTK